jgi:hypothetical protein
MIVAAGGSFNARRLDRSDTQKRCELRPNLCRPTTIVETVIIRRKNS